MHSIINLGSFQIRLKMEAGTQIGLKMDHARRQAHHPNGLEPLDTQNPNNQISRSLDIDPSSTMQLRLPRTSGRAPTAYVK